MGGLLAVNQLNTQCAASNTVCQASAAMARWTQIVEPNVKSRQGQKVIRRNMTQTSLHSATEGMFSWDNMNYHKVSLGVQFRYRSGHMLYIYIYMYIIWLQMCKSDKSRVISRFVGVVIMVIHGNTNYQHSIAPAAPRRLQPQALKAGWKAGSDGSSDLSLSCDGLSL